MKKMVLFDIDYTLFDTDVFKKTKLRKHALYREVYAVLQELSRVATLGVFSEGNIALQRMKLRKTEIHRYFPKEYTHIVEVKDHNLREILSKYKDKKLFLVDDKLPILRMAKKVLPSIFTIWVKRGIYAAEQKEIPGFKPDAIVNDLSKLAQLINNK